MWGTFGWIILSVLVISLISLVGALLLLNKRSFTAKRLPLFIAFAGGTLLSAAFFDLIPEALELGDGENVILMVLIGILVFFVLERFIFWHHHHLGEHKTHPFTYLNLIGDGLHNFIDGVVIAAAFMTDVRVGLVATVAIALHEIPQELGDFSILLYGGFSKGKALLFNFFSALGALLGAIVGYLYSTAAEGSLPYLLGFAAGGFIYISTADLIPELQKEKNFKTSLLQFLCFLIGIVVVYAFVKFLGHE